MLEDFLKDAFCFFEKERGITDDYIESRLAQSEISSASPIEVENVIVSFIGENLDSKEEFLSLALFALGKTYSNEHKQIYLNVMNKCQNSNPSACYQAAIAYENLGYQIFKGNGDVANTSSNLKYINDFLRTHAV